MDKDKIIEMLLTEWAMRSPDGLAGGINSSENINAFKSILAEYGMDSSAVDEITNDVFELDGKNSSGVDVFEGMRKKGVSKENVKKFKNVLAGYSTQVKNGQAVVAAFKDQFDKLVSLKDVLDIYEGKQFRELKPIVDELDTTNFNNLGPGEIPFVFFLKGAKSVGGSAQGGGLDILFADFTGKETGIELKKLTDQILGISQGSLKGFAKSEFSQAIVGLSQLANNSELGNAAEEFMIKVLEDEGNLYAKTNIPEGVSLDKMKLAVQNFFKEPRVAEINKGLINAILVISAKIHNKKPAPEQPAATIDVDVGKDHKKLKVADDSVADLTSQLDHIKAGDAQSKIDVNVVPTKETSDAKLENELMKQKFFNDVWDMERINVELLKLLQDNYDLILAIEKSSSKKLTDYVHQITKADIPKKLIFNSMTRGRIKFKLKD